MIKRDWIDRNCCVSDYAYAAFALVGQLQIQQVAAKDLLTGDVVILDQKVWTFMQAHVSYAGSGSFLCLEDVSGRNHGLFDDTALVWIVDRSVLNYVPGKVELR